MVSVADAEKPNESRRNVNITTMKRAISSFVCILSIGLATLEAQIWGPTYTTCSPTANTLMYTGGCAAQIPGAGRLQVRGDATNLAGSVAGNFLFPSSSTPGGAQNIGVLATSGVSTVYGSLASTGGKFVAYGGQNYNTAVEALAVFDHNQLSVANVSGVRALAQSSKATTGFVTGVSGSATTSHTSGTVASSIGVSAIVSGSGVVANGYGLLAQAVSGPAYTNAYGSFSEVFPTTSASSAFGAYGRVQGGAIRYGVRGDAPNAVPTTSFQAGVFGSAPINGTQNPLNNGTWVNNSSWAVYCNGAQFSTTNALWGTSDARMKRNIEPLEGTLKAILKLEPKTYTYDRSSHPTFHLPGGVQIGLISQEVEMVLPSLVMDTKYPDQFDENGNLIDAGFEFKAMNYNGLIPVLVGAIKEQQAIIDDKQSQIDALEERMERLEELLLGDAGKGRMNPGSSTQELQSLALSPNPFNDRTTIRYAVDCACRVRLEVTTTDGKPMATLLDEQREQGSYEHEWNTEHIAPGVYICTLVVDGKPTVKQAVKVAR